MEMTPRLSDVAIVGAGPAGSTLASLLARRGVSVTLIERERFPRDKVCGEFLSSDAMPILERTGCAGAVEQAGSAKIVRFRVVSGRARAEFDLPEPAWGISRMRLDEILLRKAASAGAGVLEGWSVDAAERGGAGRRLRLVDTQQRAMEIEARLVVGAWGRWGRLDLRMERAFTGDRRHRYIGFKRHYGAGLTDPDAIELHSFHRGYLGAQPIEGERSNLCGLVHQTEIAGLRGGWGAWIERLRRTSPSVDALLDGAVPEQEEFLSSEPVIFHPKEPVRDGIFLIGDAAGLIDPLTGNGMAFAIQSAALALAPILAALAGEEHEAAMHRYAESHRSFFAARIGWSRRIASLLRRPAILSAALRMGGRTSIASELAVRTRATPRQAAALAATL